MTFLQKITPTNLLEEKEKFLKDNSYNPQFIYAEEIPVEKLYQYGKPKQKYLELAQEILDQAYFGRNEADLLMMEGAKLTQEKVTQKVISFLEMHQLESRYKIVWSNSFVSRTSINKNTIKLRLPSDYHHEGLLGMLYHEIGTHALRRINYEQQPFFKQKNKLGFSDYLLTEEGLASLHTLLAHSFKLAFGPASRYLAVQIAQQKTFSELWQFLGKYIQDENRRWVITLRQKRGLKDTSKPGGYSKDLVYFEGMVDVWKWLNKHDFDLTNLYFGRISWEDAEKAVKINPNFKPSLPSFFTVDHVQYALKIRKIGMENNFLQI